MDLEISVSHHGPFFNDPARKSITHAGIDQVHRDIAKEGENMVGLQLIRVLKHPTGRYEAHIRHERIGTYTSRVSDGGRIVYGPWLEGVGSRNFPVTRFKGYFTFRKVTPKLQAKAASIAKRALRPFIARLNGGA